MESAPVVASEVRVVPSPRKRPQNSAVERPTKIQWAEWTTTLVESLIEIRYSDIAKQRFNSCKTNKQKASWWAWLTSRLNTRSGVAFTDKTSQKSIRNAQDWIPRHDICYQWNRKWVWGSKTSPLLGHSCCLYAGSAWHAGWAHHGFTCRAQCRQRWGYRSCEILRNLQKKSVIAAKHQNRL